MKWTVHNLCTSSLQTVLMRVLKHRTTSQLTCRAFPRVSTLSKWHARRPNRLFKQRCKTFVANGGTAGIGGRKAGSRSACTTSSSCTLLNSRGLKSIDRSTGAWGRNSRCALTRLSHAKTKEACASHPGATGVAREGSSKRTIVHRRKRTNLRQFPCAFSIEPKTCKSIRPS